MGSANTESSACCNNLYSKVLASRLQFSDQYRQRETRADEDGRRRCYHPEQVESPSSYSRIPRISSQYCYATGMEPEHDGIATEKTADQCHSLNTENLEASSRSKRCRGCQASKHQHSSSVESISSAPQLFGCQIINNCRTICRSPSD